MTEETTQEIAGEEVREMTETEKRDARCVPVARELIKIVAEEADSLLLGSLPADQLVTYYSDLHIKKVVPLFLERNVALDDIGYIHTLAMQSLQLMWDRSKMSFNELNDLATAGLWGVEKIEDVTISMLDEQLKKMGKEKDVDNAPATSAEDVV